MVTCSPLSARRCSGEYAGRFAPHGLGPAALHHREKVLAVRSDHGRPGGGLPRSALAGHPGVLPAVLVVPLVLAPRRLAISRAYGWSWPPRSYGWSWPPRSGSPRSGFRWSWPPGTPGPCGPWPGPCPGPGAGRAAGTAGAAAGAAPGRAAAASSRHRRPGVPTSAAARAAPTAAAAGEQKGEDCCGSNGEGADGADCSRGSNGEGAEGADCSRLVHLLLERAGGPCWNEGGGPCWNDGGGGPPWPPFPRGPSCSGPSGSAGRFIWEGRDPW
ncbi:hypothetical protein SCALM49S_02171 [Streptomyces californicus]